MLSTSDYVLIGLRDEIRPDKVFELLRGLLSPFQPPKIAAATAVLVDGDGWDGAQALHYQNLGILAVAVQSLIPLDAHDDDRGLTSIAVEQLLKLLALPRFSQVITSFEAGNLGIVPLAKKVDEPSGEREKPEDVEDSCIYVLSTYYLCPRWNIERIHADSLPVSNLGPGSVVAILDSGIDRSHPQLGHVAAGIRICPADTEDPANMPEDFDIYGHGTALAGIINAQAIASSSLEGIAGASKILPVKVLRNNQGENDCSAYDYEILAGLEYCCEKQITIAMMSCGAYPVRGIALYNTVIEHAAQKYSERFGGILIASSGDKGQDYLSTWAQCPHVVCVGATNSSDQIAGYSGYSTRPLPPEQAVELCAPGDPLCVATTKKQGLYERGAGTSFACPQVAAAAAALAGEYRARGQALTLEMLRERIRATCSPITAHAYPNGAQHLRSAAGSGLLNLESMLQIC